MAPVVFTALILTLYLYKSVMLILFQNKILYMPSMPPFSRSERIADYAALCKPVVWREERIRASDGTELALAVGEVNRLEQDKEEKGESRLDQKQDATEKRTHMVIIYFQGNGSSLPPRLPSLSSVLNLLYHSPSLEKTQHTLLALSYRGFWTSRGRPSEPGIALDAAAAVAHARRAYPSRADCETRIVLWGQSLGAGVAVTAAAADAADAAARATEHLDEGAPVTEKDAKVETTMIHALVLETPFTSVKAMLRALYPQKWLPYRYLGPFLRNHWDSVAALRSLGDITTPITTITTTAAAATAAKEPKLPKILILQAGRDELVPGTHGEELERVGKGVGLDVRRVVVGGALHVEVMARGAGRGAVVEFLRDIG